MNRNRLLLLVTLIVFIGSCRKGDEKSGPRLIPIADQRLIDAVSFKTGTYFVYVDSATGDIDSMGAVLIGHRDYFDKDSNANIEVLAYNAEAGQNLVRVYAKQNRLYCDVKHSYLGFVAYLAKFPGNNIGLREVINIHKEYPGIDSVVVRYSHFDSYLVLGKTYHDVFATESTNYDVYDSIGFTYRCYYSMTDGMIRMEYKAFNSNTYSVQNLIRSHIVR